MQQKWFYEVAKGSLHATAIRCLACRKRLRELHDGNGDPYPIKHDGTLINLVQASIHSAVVDAGFVLVRKSKLPTGSLSLDYSRNDLTLVCWYDRSHATLVAEVLDNTSGHIQVACLAADFPITKVQASDLTTQLSEALARYLSSQSPA